VISGTRKCRCSTLKYLHKQTNEWRCTTKGLFIISSPLYDDSPHTQTLKPQNSPLHPITRCISPPPARTEFASPVFSQKTTQPGRSFAPKNFRQNPQCSKLPDQTMEFSNKVCIGIKYAGEDAELYNVYDIFLILHILCSPALYLRSSQNHIEQLFWFFCD